MPEFGQITFLSRSQPTFQRELKTMRTTYAVILCVLLLLFSACAQKVNDPADVQAIKNLYLEFDKADMANDTAWFTSAYFLDGAVRMPPNEAMLTGKEAIGKQIQMDHDKNTPVSEVSSVDEVLSSGDLAIARGKYTSTWTPKASGLGTITERGKWVAALRRQSDGKWKCVHEIWNSDQPAPGRTASGEDEQALYQIERELTAANPKKDTAVYDRLLSNDFVWGSTGRTLNKKRYLAWMKANPAKIESAASSEMNAIVFGDTAVVHGLYIEKSTTSGKDTSGQYRFTDVFVKRDGRWQCVTEYVTGVQ